jgi:hypothetical protein
LLHRQTVQSLLNVGVLAVVAVAHQMVLETLLVAEAVVVLIPN